MKRLPPKSTVLLLGSGGLRIGQAGEFDYSGSQAIKALKKEGMRVVLVNPNIATVQTDEDLADEIYLEPLCAPVVRKIIEQERPAGVLLGFGGQTALNLGLELEKEGVFKREGVAVLGTPVSAIRISEDRELFKKALDEIQVHTAKSIATYSLSEALNAANEIGYPVMIRSGFALGGLGSGKVESEEELSVRAKESFSHAPQVLIEEYLGGWKEIEYEIMRDAQGNALTVCNMENFDPMGIHTGESIVIAPSQTLTNEEYHLLREVALKVAGHLGIIGECNIQYALNPKTGEYRVIEVNARLSRSSALASKATGYPIAFVAAKLSIGCLLHELKNQVTQKTCAFFEPALDYVVVKMPRWDIGKFRNADRRIGSEMKSVGEVMAIGRTFPEALQKAVRMLNIRSQGITDPPQAIESPIQEVKFATDRRLFALYLVMKEGLTVEKIHEISQIDSWFLHQLERIVRLEEELTEELLDEDLLRKAKKLGFSDQSIGQIYRKSEEEIRLLRIEKGIVPFVKQIDTLAGEFGAETNYLYLTYNGRSHDLVPSENPPIIVLGSGPYSIGSSVEFDWCAVNALKSFRKFGEATLMINSNPETVSTDYDESERLYFEEISHERVRDIADFENPKGILLSVGGQIANNLAVSLGQGGYPILGTEVKYIDQAENRKHFSTLLSELSIDQPRWAEVNSSKEAKIFVEEVGYPILIRPSYVLSGSAMNVVEQESDLSHLLEQAFEVSSGHPVVISEFIDHAKELEIDGVAKNGNIVLEAITEHIENAGVHSGDATVVLPPQTLYLETIRRTKQITRQIVKALNITGPFNIQFIAKENAIKVIECNLRASRSFPFVSKVSRHNLIETTVKTLLNKPLPPSFETLELDCVGVKTPQFSFHRLKGADTVAQVEMASTGEVACLGDNLSAAFFRSWLAAGQQIQGKRLLVSIGSGKRERYLDQLKKLEDKGWTLFATEGTHDWLVQRGVACHFLYKASDEIEPNVLTLLGNRGVDLIVNIPTKRSSKVRTDGFRIRRLATDLNIPLITNSQIAQLFLNCLISIDLETLLIKPWRAYTEKGIF